MKKTILVSLLGVGLMMILVGASIGSGYFPAGNLPGYDDPTYYSPYYVDILGTSWNRFTTALILVVVGIVSVVVSVFILDDMAVDKVAAEEEAAEAAKKASELAQEEAKAKNRAKGFLDKTWRVVNTYATLDDGCWCLLLCLRDINGSKEFMDVGFGHAYSETYFFLKAGDRVNFSFADVDQAEEDPFEESSFLIPEVSFEIDSQSS